MVGKITSIPYIECLRCFNSWAFVLYLYWWHPPPSLKIEGETLMKNLKEGKIENFRNFSKSSRKIKTLWGKNWVFPSVYVLCMSYQLVVSTTINYIKRKLVERGDMFLNWITLFLNVCFPHGKGFCFPHGIDSPCIKYMYIWLFIQDWILI